MPAPSSTIGTMRSKKHKHILILLLIASAIIIAGVFWNSSTEAPNPAINNTNNSSSSDTNTPNSNNSPNENEAIPISIDKIMSQTGFWIDLLEDSSNYTKSGEGDITSYSFTTENTVTVMPLGSESMVKEGFSPISEENITIDGSPATKITAASPKDGTEIQYILISGPVHVYMIRGTQDFLQQVEENIKIKH